MVGLLLLDLVCCYRLRLTSPATAAATSIRPLAADLWRLMAVPRVAVFVVWCLLVGILTSLIWQWLPWFLSELADVQAHNQVNIRLILPCQPLCFSRKAYKLNPYCA
jgi:hypothetical protein